MVLTLLLNSTGIYDVGQHAFHASCAFFWKFCKHQ